MKGKTKKPPEKCAPASTPDDTAAASRFQKDLEERGEAAELTSDGKLPLKATHAIVKKPDGTKELKRARYKLF
jgi:hypothetical protein